MKFWLPDNQQLLIRKKKIHVQRFFSHLCTAVPISDALHSEEQYFRFYVVIHHLLAQLSHRCHSDFDDRPKLTGTQRRRRCFAFGQHVAQHRSRVTPSAKAPVDGVVTAFRWLRSIFVLRDDTSCVTQLSV